MDVNTMINVLLGITCGGLGWLLRVLWEAQDRLQRDLAELERGLPETYVRRDDFKEIVAQMMSRFDRLDQKIDKINDSRSERNGTS